MAMRLRGHEHFHARRVTDDPESAWRIVHTTASGIEMFMYLLSPASADKFDGEVITMAPCEELVCSPALLN